MAALVEQWVVRYTIVGTLGGQDCMNVFDIYVGDDVIGERSTAIEQCAQDLLNQWDDHILPVVVNDYTAVQVRWVDLDTAEGETGSISSTDENTWPKDGSVAGDPLPNNAYAKVVKNLQGKTRTQRNGATRLGGLAEGYTGATTPNTLNLADRTAITDAFQSMQDGIEAAGSEALTYFVVVHTVDGVATGHTRVASFSCAPVVGTIRRRMPGYGT